VGRQKRLPIVWQIGTIWGEMDMFKTLLVEDNTAFRQSLREILNKQFPSIAIEEAADADEAMQKVDLFLPNLIFMDIKLPNGNGLDLTKKIKKEHPEMNIIILTSYDFLEYRLAAAQYGANHFLSKASVTREEITVLVKSFLEKECAAQ
jgi:YesN/AraC family two-component response regulator